MSISFNHDNKAVTEAAIAHISSSTHSNELSEHDSSLIDSFKNKVFDQDGKIKDLNGLKSLINNLNRSVDWKIDIGDFTDNDSKRGGEVSNKCVMEIIKLIANANNSTIRRSIMMNIGHSGMSEEEKIEIAKLCIEKNPQIALICLGGFSIGSREELTACYKLALESFIKQGSIKDNAEFLMWELAKNDVANKQELVAMLLHIADFRPDQVRENLDKFDLSESEIDEIKSKCTLMEPPPATAKIDSLREKSLVFSDPGYSAQKIRNAVRIQPNSEMQKIFNLFKSIAENPEVELMGRTRWKSAQEYKDEENMIDYCLDMLAPRQLKEDTADRRCGHTVSALETSIFGKQNPQTNKSKLEKDLLNQDELNKLWSTVKENENLLDGKSKFFAYSMELENLDHAFMVIQHKDEHDNVKYRILQSWVNQHSLNDYMVNRGDDLTSDEFTDFTNGFNHVLLHDKWTDEKGDFYKDYFMKDENSLRSVGEDHVETNFEIKWGSSNLDHLLVQKAQFEDFKEKHIVKLIQSPIPQVPSTTLGTKQPPLPSMPGSQASLGTGQPALPAIPGPKAAGQPALPPIPGQPPLPQIPSNS